MLLNVENRRLKTGGETLNPAVFYTHTHTHTPIKALPRKFKNIFFNLNNTISVRIIRAEFFLYEGERR